jgi:GntR family transcriptional repressor for pyruvate dehydrogenase complex
MREAMRILASKGLIEVSQGRTARVREADPGTVVESIGTFVRRSPQSPLGLLEVRRPLETEVAALAAVRATPEQVVALRESNERLAAARGLAEQVAADLEFHQRLAEATGNPVFVLLQQALAQLMKEYLMGTMKRIGSQRAIRSHAPIVNAIQSGDAKEARRCMAEHLQMAEEDVRRTSES